jgi:hypothetical protein
LTAQGHPRTIFGRAIKSRNLIVAELTARDLGRLSLDESLALTALVACQEPGRRSRFAVRWLVRLLEEDDPLSIQEVALAASALATLGGRGHIEALATLSAMAEKATRNARARRGGVLSGPAIAGEALVRPA